MKINLKIAILMMLLLMIRTFPLYAGESRSVRIVIRDSAGQAVGLYENSYALVIGVSDYTNGWPDLPGVQNEVAPILTALEKHGFDVTVVENPNSAERWWFSKDVWIDLDSSHNLAELVKEYCRHLGKESLYDLSDI